MPPDKVWRIVQAWLWGNFLRYQLKWILDESRFAGCLKGRQLGFTDAMAARCLIRAYFRGRPQIVISAAEKNAKEMLEAVRKHCRFLSELGIAGVLDMVVDNETTIEWRTGGSITAQASSTRTARSFHGDVTLDEFAYHLDQEGIWKAAAPMATRGDWQLRVITTPNGAIGKAYEFFTDPGKAWSIHRVSLTNAIDDGLKVNRSDLMALVNGDERAFAEAYELAFLDADMQYLPGELIDRVFAPYQIPDGDHEGTAGLDIGRVQDLTALSYTLVPDGHAIGAAMLTCKRTAFKKQRRMLDGARKALSWSRIAIDETGMGKQLAEELEESWGSDEVERVTFTNEVKGELATRLFRWAANGRLHVLDAPELAPLRDEMRALRRKVTAAGNVTYEVPRTAKGHGDRLWAFALSLHAASALRGPIEMGDSPLLAVA